MWHFVIKLWHSLNLNYCKILISFLNVSSSRNLLIWQKHREWVITVEKVSMMEGLESKQQRFGFTVVLCLASIQFWLEHKIPTSLSFQWVTSRIMKGCALRQLQLAESLFQCFSAEGSEETLSYPALPSCRQLGGSSLPDENQLRVEVTTGMKPSCESWSSLLNAE